MTANRRRRASPGGYYAQVGGIGRSSERIEIDEETDLAAVRAAFGATTVFGHTLGAGRRFLGYFAPGDARLARKAPEPFRGLRRAPRRHGNP